MISATVVVTIAGMVTGLGMTRRMDSERMCTQLEILITDSADRQFVTEKELIRLLRTQELYPVGKQIARLSTARIENTIQAHPMIRRAECYPTTEGHIVVRLSQRIPLIKVVTAAETYFVDTDRRPMPVRESVTTEVIKAYGNIGERMAREELADLALWLKRNRYWSPRIRAIRVADTKHIYLVQHDGEPQILIGELSGYERKLRKLRTFLEEGYPELPEQPQYRELDIRFKDQVIGR